MNALFVAYFASCNSVMSVGNLTIEYDKPINSTAAINDISSIVKERLAEEQLAKGIHWDQQKASISLLNWRRLED